MIKYILLLIMTMPSLILAQSNMVPNGDFEDLVDCPTALSQVYQSSGWVEVYGTPDFFHTCAPNGDVRVPVNFFGDQLAANGGAYVGYYDYLANRPDRREYLGRQIIPLVPGVAYEVSLSISLGDACEYATDGLGVFFYDKGYPLPSGQILTVTPQISFSSDGPFANKDGWVRLSKTFIADSAYGNIIIGGFKNDATLNVKKLSGLLPSAYYYIDSFVIRQPGAVDTSTESTAISVCQGGSISMSYYFPSTLTFAVDNTFILQLSDSKGSFNNAIDIAIIKSTNPIGNMKGTVPDTLPVGDGYKMRIISTNPVLIYSNSLTIAVKKHPVVSASGNKSFCPGNEIKLFAFGADKVEWQGPESFQSTVQNPVIRYTTELNAGSYIVSSVLNGCMATDTIHVTIACGIIDVPSAFTPNGDGANDVLFVRGNDEVAELRLDIYNRWGQIVFTTSDMGIGWDGRFKGQELNNEVFAYILKAKFRDGTDFYKKGNISLIK